MKLPQFFRLLFIAALLSPGCAKEPTPPAPLAVEQIPAAMDAEFQIATPEIRDAAAGMVAAVKQNELPTAFDKLQELSSRGDLSPAQRATASRAMMGVAQSLQNAASNGDAKAAEALHRYQTTR